jgi:hypothetical protein
MKKLLIASLCVLTAFPLLVKAESTVDFNRDVRPILNRKCTSCHGGVKRKGGFSFLYRNETTKPAKSGLAPIVPGKADESEMIHRVLLRDDEEMMPPKGDRLTDKEVATLKQWIKEGAPYAEHWAYMPPKRHDAPSVTNNKWGRNHIDPFILHRLESQGLKPSPEASPEKLIRRLHLDLVGLPPDLETIERFTSDPSEQAYEEEVDRILSSPHFGERWAAMWLDLARYADTKGYEKDSARSMSPYRDWVIKAFNRDPGFDTFTIEQLAGDLLPNPTEAQLVATGFHRNTMTNSEGGTDDEEFRVAAIVDRVNTTWDVWMGTSFGCVQCHNHPYDPFMQTEYYQFMDFLNQTEDADRDNDAPFIHVPNEDQRKKLDALQAKLDELKNSKTQLDKNADQAQKDWEASVLEESLTWDNAEITKPTSREKGVTFSELEDGSILVGGENTFRDRYTFRLEAGTNRVGAIRLDVLPHETLPAGGSGRGEKGEFILSRITVNLVEKSEAGKESRKKQEIIYAEADSSRKNFPIEAARTGNRPRFEGWSPEIDGAEHWATFGLKDSLESGGDAQLEVELLFDNRAGQNTIGRFKVSTAEEPIAAREHKARHMVASVIKKPKNERSKKELAILHDAFLLVFDEYLSVQKDIKAVEKEMESFKGTQTLVMRELPADKQRDTHVFNGGNWMAHGDKVTAGTPAMMPAFGDRPRNRLGLAQWIVSRENPLTARVIVNRFWEQLFGNGLVTTMADFGTQGEAPTHPALLDDLAVRWMEDQDWSVKALLKSFVMSSTYRQDSDIPPGLLEKDPQNLLLARGARYRLPAETIRDQSLAVSGLLSDKMYGKSVMPPQPEGVWQSVYNGADWKTDSGEDRYRRGLYTYWKRTSPYPSMETFDVPSREFCMPRRIRTNTPLQALVTLNDPAFFEAAQALAGRMLEAGNGDLEAGLTNGFKIVLARKPSKQELSRLTELLRDEQKRFSTETEAAMKLSGSKDDSAERAAWVMAANVLLNLDETLTRE